MVRPEQENYLNSRQLINLNLNWLILTNLKNWLIKENIT